MMSSWLIALDKHPWVRTVGVGEIWKRLIAKFLLRVTGQEAKDACGTYQIADGIESGIEGGIHYMHLLWAQHPQEEDWRFLLINRRNYFNKENRKAMLLDFRHEWPGGA